METISIIIPSRGEKYLNATIKDVLDKATGSVEVIVVLEEYDEKRIEGVTYIYHPKALGMRYAINEAVNISRGKYIMKLDAHCIVAPGFDEQLKKDHQDNWLQVPRKYSILENEWQPNFNDPIDYEYWIYPLRYPNASLHGFRWLTKGQERKHILIDDNLTFQGSCWFMSKDWWDKCDFMNDEGYNQLHAQEAVYLGNTTWMNEGRVVINKNTWYAHLFKSKQAGRGYPMDEMKRRACYKYSYQHWVLDNKEDFISLIEQFWPLPNWPENWREILWN